MLLSQLVPASGLPVSLAALKQHCRVDHGDEDTALLGNLDAATAAVGAASGRILMPETWRLSIPGATGDVALPRSPVRALHAISYFDAAGIEQSVDVSNFHLFADEDRAVVRPKAGQSWPSAQPRDDALHIDFIAGYERLPNNLRQAILMLAGYWYEQRGTAAAEGAEIPKSVDYLVSLSRTGWVAA